MNEHIQRANQAMTRGDRDEALLEYYEALNDVDADETDRRIARHRLHELTPNVVFASSSSYLYHRPECIAKEKIWRNHLVTFNDWRDAESAGYLGCSICNPPRPGSVNVE